MPSKIELISAPQLKGANTIFDALKIIEDHQWMIVVVIDDNNRLCGVVSSGDLRKAILNGHSVHAALDSVMNRNPVSIGMADVRDSAKVGHIMDHLKRRYDHIAMMYALIPVVDEDNRVMGLISLDSLTSYMEMPKIPPSHNKTVLVVGGAGYIGSVLTRILLADGWAVRVLDKLIYSDSSLQGLGKEKFELIRGDAGNIDDIVNAINGVDAVVYLAELVGDPACSVAPQFALKTNYLAVTSMAHLCSHLNINRFIYTSSCSVYGASKDPDTFLTEESPLHPVSLYARMKTLVEESIFSVCNLPNPLFAPTILRLATVFGHSYRPRFDLVVNTFVKNSLQEGRLEVFGGNQWRPNVHVSDVGQAILKVLNAPVQNVRAQIFNVGRTDLNYTINDLAGLAKEVFPDIAIMKKDKATDLRNYRVDFSKIERALNFRAAIDVKAGMLEIKKAFESKELADLDDSRYSNVKRMQELNFV